MASTRIVHPDQLTASDVTALLGDPSSGVITVVSQPGAPTPVGAGASMLMLRSGASAATPHGTVITNADAVVVTDGTSQPLVFTDPVEGLREYAEILDLIAEDLIASMEASANGADLVAWIRARDAALVEADRRSQGNAAETQKPGAQEPDALENTAPA